MIDLVAIERRFGEFCLQDIRLRVETGRLAVLLGPSGSGKSLLLSVVAGMVQPDSGRILLAGQDVTHMPPEQRKLGWVMQQPSLFPHLSVWDNIGYGLKVRGLPRDQIMHTVDQWVETLRLQDLLRRPVTQLSGGEAQKVALARALAIQPRVLLLDEPLSALDFNTRLELQEEIRRVHQQLKLTTLYVTHHREEAQSLGQDCALMLGGRILQTGPISEVFERPCCAYVARFLGRPETQATEVSSCSQHCLLGFATCDRAEESSGH